MNKKKEFKYFTIFNHAKEEEYLRTMHKSGWRFVRVSGLGMYHFEECEPEDVVYRLDYNKDAVKNKEEYLKIFDDCGWEYLQNYAGYSYFRKPAENSDADEDIFCDDESHLDMMKRVYRGRMIPLLIIFSLILIPQFFLSLFSLENYIMAAIDAGLIVLYLGVFLKFAVSYHRYKKYLSNK